MNLFLVCGHPKGVRTRLAEALTAAACVRSSEACDWQSTFWNKETVVGWEEAGLRLASQRRGAGLSPLLASAPGAPAPP
eukprot:1089650-Prymnesium_polylepis.2